MLLLTTLLPPSPNHRPRSVLRMAALPACGWVRAMRCQQTPSDGMGPQNNRHVGDSRYCQTENNLSPAERAATLGV